MDFVKDTTLTLTNLKQKTKYYWKVKAFTQGNTNVVYSTSGEFVTAAFKMSTSINDLNIVSPFSFTNSNDMLHINTQYQHYTISIFNMYGQLCTTAQNIATLSLDKYSKGLYLIQFSTDNIQVTQKLLLP